MAILSLLWNSTCRHQFGISNKIPDQHVFTRLIPFGSLCRLLWNCAEHVTLLCCSAQNKLHIGARIYRKKHRYPLLVLSCCTTIALVLGTTQWLSPIVSHPHLEISGISIGSDSLGSYGAVAQYITNHSIHLHQHAHTSIASSCDIVHVHDAADHHGTSMLPLAFQLLNTTTCISSASPDPGSLLSVPTISCTFSRIGKSLYDHLEIMLLRSGMPPHPGPARSTLTLLAWNINALSTYLPSVLARPFDLCFVQEVSAPAHMFSSLFQRIRQEKCRAL